jgi:predicted O-methyltransferase YrrM
MICFSLKLLFLKLSFQEWTQQVQDMLNTKKFGDISFGDKDFKNAIEYYSKVCSHISSGGLIIINMYEWG